MRHQQTRAGELGEPPAKVEPDHALCRCIERRCRLIEKEQTWPRCQSAGQRHPLGLTPRDLCRPSRGQVVDAKTGQLLPCNDYSFAAPPAPSAKTEGDVVDHRQVREQKVILEHETDLPFFAGEVQAGVGVIEDITIEGDASLVDWQKARERVEEGSLARAIRTKQRNRGIGARAQLHVEQESPHPGLDASIERHKPASQRSRSATRTPTETIRRSRLSNVASSGLVWRPT